MLDIFLGSGTTLIVAKELGMHGIGIELIEKNIDIINKRLNKEVREIDGN